LQWINALKIAIVEENEEKIERLIQELPCFDDVQTMENAAYLLKEAHTLLSLKKDALASNLIKIKKQKEFLNALSSSSPSFNQSH
jgi:hypothetical protein